MDKMNGKFYKYTLILLGVSILFIIIGGISVSRVDEYSPEPVETQTVVSQEYNDLQENEARLGAQNQQIVDILHEEITDEEKIDKIETIIFGEPKAE